MDESKNAVALGYFDGLHKGHKTVIARSLSMKERGLNPVVLLFDSHPLLSLTGEAPKEILQSTIREEMIKEMGASFVYISFSEIKNMSPREFFEEILLKRINAGALCCGENYHFGKDGKGDRNTLYGLCNEYNIPLSVSPLVDFKGFPVSSTSIRNAVSSGNISDANEMLGYEFKYRAVVKSGCQRGHLIGAPTINQYFDDNFIIPKNGVYASVTIVDDKDYPSVTNIGLRPTFENEDLRSETCIIGFDGDLYGREITVSLVDRIRDEMRFDSMDELRKQIAEDAEVSKRKFLNRRYNHV